MQVYILNRRVDTRADFNPLSYVNDIRSFSFSYKPHDKMFSIVGMKDVYCMQKNAVIAVRLYRPMCIILEWAGAGYVRAKGRGRGLAC